MAAKNMYWKDIPEEGYVTKDTYEAGHVAYRWNRHFPRSEHHLTYTLFWYGNEAGDAHQALDKRANEDLIKWDKWEEENFQPMSDEEIRLEARGGMYKHM
jgi:hypothetical protein